jgi:hypothetical protein
MYDVDNIVKSYEAHEEARVLKERIKEAKFKARYYLFMTGSIPVEEYLYLHYGNRGVTYEPDGREILRLIKERNRVWEDPRSFDECIMTPYIEAGNTSF